ncbi:hypothetical protein DICVIV_08867 [Dictyocaulus viviparus]|uniref:BZIP domain-containing protein n=1 Tax=Dictyocaulus viviparus TaxID=29172 RepID=A0A0D8XMV2_DICVI|nr:hypothetical protein DICVIV_08867 [Dictyocaulus viviparus]
MASQAYDKVLTMVDRTVNNAGELLRRLKPRSSKQHSKRESVISEEYATSPTNLHNNSSVRTSRSHSNRKASRRRRRRRAAVDDPEASSDHCDVTIEHADNIFITYDSDVLAIKTSDKSFSSIRSRSSKRSDHDDVKPQEEPSSKKSVDEICPSGRSSKKKSKAKNLTNKDLTGKRDRSRKSERSASTKSSCRTTSLNVKKLTSSKEQRKSRHPSSSHASTKDAISKYACKGLCRRKFEQTVLGPSGEECEECFRTRRKLHPRDPYRKSQISSKASKSKEKSSKRTKLSMKKSLPIRHKKQRPIDPYRLPKNLTRSIAPKKKPDDKMPSVKKTATSNKMPLAKVSCPATKICSKISAPLKHAVAHSKSSKTQSKKSSEKPQLQRPHQQQKKSSATTASSKRVVAKKKSSPKQQKKSSATTASAKRVVAKKKSSPKPQIKSSATTASAKRVDAKNKSSHKQQKKSSATIAPTQRIDDGKKPSVKSIKKKLYPKDPYRPPKGKTKTAIPVKHVVGSSYSSSISTKSAKKTHSRDSYRLSTKSSRATDNKLRSSSKTSSKSRKKLYPRDPYRPPRKPSKANIPVKQDQNKKPSSTASKKLYVKPKSQVSLHSSKKLPKTKIPVAKKDHKAEKRGTKRDNQPRCTSQHAKNVNERRISSQKDSKKVNIVNHKLPTLKKTEPHLHKSDDQKSRVTNSLPSSNVDSGKVTVQLGFLANSSRKKYVRTPSLAHSKRSQGRKSTKLRMQGETKNSICSESSKKSMKKSSITSEESQKSIRKAEKSEVKQQPTESSGLAIEVYTTASGSVIMDPTPEFHRVEVEKLGKQYPRTETKSSLKKKHREEKRKHQQAKKCDSYLNLTLKQYAISGRKTVKPSEKAEKSEKPKKENKQAKKLDKVQSTLLIPMSSRQLVPAVAPTIQRTPVPPQSTAKKHDIVEKQTKMNAKATKLQRSDKFNPSKTHLSSSETKSASSSSVMNDSSKTFHNVDVNKLGKSYQRTESKRSQEKMHKKEHKKREHKQAKKCDSYLELLLKQNVISGRKTKKTSELSTTREFEEKRREKGEMTRVSSGAEESKSRKQLPVAQECPVSSTSQKAKSSREFQHVDVEKLGKRYPRTESKSSLKKKHKKEKRKLKHAKKYDSYLNLAINQYAISGRKVVKALQEHKEATEKLQKLPDIIDFPSETQLSEFKTKSTSSSSTSLVINEPEKKFHNVDVEKLGKTYPRTETKSSQKKRHKKEKLKQKRAKKYDSYLNLALKQYAVSGRKVIKALKERKKAADELRKLPDIVDSTSETQIAASEAKSTSSTSALHDPLRKFHHVDVEKLGKLYQRTDTKKSLEKKNKKEKRKHRQAMKSDSYLNFLLRQNLISGRKIGITSEPPSSSSTSTTSAKSDDKNRDKSSSILKTAIENTTSNVTTEKHGVKKPEMQTSKASQTTFDVDSKRRSIPSLLSSGRSYTNQCSPLDITTTPVLSPHTRSSLCRNFGTETASDASMKSTTNPKGCFTPSLISSVGRSGRSSILRSRAFDHTRTTTSVPQTQSSERRIPTTSILTKCNCSFERRSTPSIVSSGRSSMQPSCQVDLTTTPILSPHTRSTLYKNFNMQTPKPPTRRSDASHMGRSTLSLISSEQSSLPQSRTNINMSTPMYAPHTQSSKSQRCCSKTTTLLKPRRSADRRDCKKWVCSEEYLLNHKLLTD